MNDSSTRRLFKNLRVLRKESIPKLEKNIALMEEQRCTLTVKEDVECCDATLVKMEAVKNYALTQHKFFTVRLMQSEVGDCRDLSEHDLTKMNKIVLSLSNMCAMDAGLWSDELKRLVRVMKENPKIPVFVACFGAVIGGAIGLLVGKGLLGSAVAGCCGAHATATWGALAMYVGAGAVLGAGIGLVVVGICYAIYTRYYPPATATASDDAKKFAELLKRTSDGEVSLKLDQMYKDMRDLMGDMTGCHQLNEEDQECCVCHLDMTVCPHPPAARHDGACAVLPFDCRHALCFECSGHSAISICPLCRASRI